MKLKTKKVSRLIAMILTILIVASISVPAHVEAATTVTYDITKTIKGTVSADGKTLTLQGSGEIPANTFSSVGNHKKIVGKIQTIIFKGSITEIGRGAFTGCTNLNKLTLNEGLKIIYSGAFTKCTGLKNVTIPKSVTLVQNGAFSTKTTIKCSNANLKKYSTNGFRINDTLKFNAYPQNELAVNLYNAINEKRRKSNIKKLTMDAELQRHAMERAAELMVLFSHTRPNGEKYISVNEYVLAEVIDESTSSDANTILKKTIANTKNNSIIMSKAYGYVGIACVMDNSGRRYIVQLYSKDKVGKTYEFKTQKSAAFTIFYPQGTSTIKLPYEAITNLTSTNRSKLAAGRSYTHPFKINSGNIKLMVGETKQVALTSGTITFAQTTGPWASENKNVATVSNKGVITAKGGGTTKIWAGTTLTPKRASIEVSVRNKIRLFGNDRYLTSYAVANRLKAVLGVSKFDSIIIATGADYPDALAGAYLGKVKKAPIILIHKDRKTSITDAVNYVKNNLKAGGKVYILGGTAVVPTTLDTQIRSKGYTVKRLGGANRYETNINIFKEAGVKNTDVIVTTGMDFRDPLIASATGYPLLIVNNTGKLLPVQQNYLQGKGIKRFTIVGSASKVPSATQTALKKYSSKVLRIYGANNFETSTEVANQFISQPKGIMLAVENNFPDAVSGGPLAIYTKSPLFLLDNAHTSYAKTYAKNNKIYTGYVLGGTGLISDSAVRTIMMW